VYIDSSNPKLPVIILSHGLGGNLNSNFLMCREFVRMGFIVFAIDHEDEIIGDVSFEARNKDLKKRVSQVKDVIAWIKDSKKL